ncbi:hypothetical protein CMI37_38910 [Candidatus Pacearchaeota archaeon]|nr:hypothetical protein [Candidatus Pacearchaeota archaeon]|tara:strand:- start:791 stop:1165 length:375 start_codon:yes stop_codon:yes gene_type:complete
MKVEVIKEEGGNKMSQESLKSFGEVLGGGEFYPDLPRVDFKDLVGKPLLVHDAQLIEDFPTKFGTHDALLLKIELETVSDDGAKTFTTITSGKVVIKRVIKALAEKLLPLRGTITKSETYYNIL